jgi:hypothetical protein
MTRSGVPPWEQEKYRQEAQWHWGEWPVCGPLDQAQKRHLSPTTDFYLQRKWAALEAGTDTKHSEEPTHT